MGEVVCKIGKSRDNFILRIDGDMLFGNTRSAHSSCLKISCTAPTRSFPPGALVC